MTPTPFPAPQPAPATATRLLSPTRRRICTIDAARQARDPNLAINLRHAGWTNYPGPAKTDKNGWVIPGTDQAVDILATGRHENLGREWEA